MKARPVATQGKPAFPQTEEGVTDWETVFEDPENGLIKVISAAHSPDAVRSSMRVVISSLFTRKTDELELARLLKQVDEICEATPGEGNPTDRAVALLRQIKSLRIEKAQAYLAEKASGAKKEKERRTQSATAKAEAQAYRSLQRPKLLIATLAGAVVLLVAVLLALVPGIQNIFDVDFTNEFATAEPETTPEAKPKPVPRPVAPKPTSKSAGDPPELPPAVILRRIGLPENIGDTRRDNRYVLPVIMMIDRGKVSLVCGQAPKLYNFINVELSKAKARGVDLTTHALRGVGTTLVDSLNSLFTAPVVTGVQLIELESKRGFYTKNCSAATAEVGELLKQ